MPAVSNLYGRRRPGGNTPPIFGGVITANDVHTWVCEKPRFDQFCVAIRQQINGTAVFEVNENGAVQLRFPQRKIIYANDARRWLVRQDSVMDNS